MTLRRFVGAVIGRFRGASGTSGPVSRRSDTGLGRREFLRLAAGVLAEAAFSPLATVITHGDAYINRKLGLSFARPAHWSYEALMDFSDLKSGSLVEYLEEFGSELALELDEDIPELESSNPLAVISKHGTTHDAFSPSIVIYFSDLSYRVGTPREMAASVLEMNRVMLDDFELIHPASDLVISGCPASRAKASFQFSHPAIDPVAVDLENYLVFTGAGQYNIQLFDSPATDQAAQREFSEFLQSIRIA